MFCIGELVSWTARDGTRHYGAIAGKVPGKFMEATGSWRVRMSGKFRYSRSYDAYEQRLCMTEVHQKQNDMKLHRLGVLA